MAKVKITGHASGTGILTVTAPNTSTDRTITLPDSTGTLATTDDTTDLDGAVTINESGADVDFRVEGSGVANALFIEGSNGYVGINGNTPPERLSIHETETSTGTYLPVAITGSNHATGYGVGISFKTENTSTTQKAKAAIIAEGTGEGYNKTSLHIAMSNTGDTTTEVALADSVLEFTMDGRGVSQFTAKAWVNFNGDGTLAVRDSHNISSVTDNGSGSYTPTFTNAIANANSVVTGNADHPGHWYGWLSVRGHSTANCTVHAVKASTNASTDAGQIDVLVFGD